MPPSELLLSLSGAPDAFRIPAMLPTMPSPSGCSDASGAGYRAQQPLLLPNPPHNWCRAGTLILTPPPAPTPCHAIRVFDYHGPAAPPTMALAVRSKRTDEVGA